MWNVRYLSILIVLLAFVLAACGDDDEDATSDATATTESPQGQVDPTATPADAADDVENTPTTETADPTATATDVADPTATTDSGDAAGTTPSPADQSGTAENVFPAGDAGEVELERDGNNLRLVEVRPADGWRYEVEDDDDDEIEIEFRDNGREIDFEAELDDGRLKVDVCDVVLDPTGDVYTIGEAGEVEVRIEQRQGDDDPELVLVEVRPNDGWEYEIDEEDDDEIEVEFRNGDQRLKFDLEVDDDEIEAKTCTRTIHTTSPGAAQGGTSGGDDVYPAGDAGEVELTRDGDELRLVEVRPNDGWRYEVEEDDDDEIEVEFRDNGREIDFEAELDDGRLEVDVCDVVLDPVGDVYTIGEAGEVEVRVVDDGDDDRELELVEVRPNDGWEYEIDEEDDDEIEIEFRNGDQHLKFDLEIDDDDDEWLEAKTCTRTVH